MTLRFAMVVAVHPALRAVDLVFQDNGQPAARVRVMTHNGSGDTGTWDVPSVPAPASPQAAGGLNPPGRRNMIAVVDTIGLIPIVVGFTHPADGPLVSSEQDRSITRHASGAYTTVAPDGSIETYHPSGSYIRIGTGPHQALPEAPAGTAPEPTVTVSTPNFTLTIAPGSIVTLVSAGMVTMTMPELVLNTNVQLNGHMNATGDIVAGTISQQHHVHSGVLHGGADTDAPVP